SVYCTHASNCESVFTRSPVCGFQRKQASGHESRSAGLSEWKMPRPLCVHAAFVPLTLKQCIAANRFGSAGSRAAIWRPKSKMYWLVVPIGQKPPPPVVLPNVLTQLCPASLRPQSQLLMLSVYVVSPAAARLNGLPRRRRASYFSRVVCAASGP